MIGTEISGIEFNNIFPNTNFVKLTNDMENHNNFQFHDGLNIDTIPFNPTGVCKKGGIYFIIKENAWKWITYKNIITKYIREVIIPDDARVYIEAGKFKTDKIILEKRELINKNIYLAHVIHHNNYYDVLCNNAYVHFVKLDGMYLQYVPSLFRNEEICTEAVKQNADALQYVPTFMHGCIIKNIPSLNIYMTNFKPDSIL